MTEVAQTDAHHVLRDCSNEHCQRLHSYLTAPDACITLQYEDYAHPLRHHTGEIVGRVETPTRTLYTRWTPGDYFRTLTVDEGTQDVINVKSASDIKVLYYLWLEYGLRVVPVSVTPFENGESDG